jgi:TP901 family phage tail tape measure protein
MAGAFTIPTIYTAVDQMSPTVQRMRQNVIGFGNSAEAAINRVERGVRKLGLGEVQKQLLSMVSTGAALAGAFQLGSFSFNSLADYETAVDSFRVIVSDLNDSQFAPFQNKINEVAKTTKRSGTEVAQAFEQIASKNATFAQTAEGLGQVTQASITLAKAARMDLGVAAENLVGIMNQFSFGADKANRTINVLAAGQAVGAASITQTAEAFVNLGPTAAGANVTLEESVGLIQTLAKFSLYGADAGTALRGSIIKLQKAGLGYKSGQFSINDALDDTNKLLDKLHTAKQKDALITAIFGIHNITAGKILTANRDTYHQFTKAVTGTSEAQKGADINSGNLRTTIQQLSAGWVNMLTASDKVGSGMTAISDAAKWLTVNLDSVVSTAVNAVKVFIAYKAIMFTAKSAMLAWNITLGISSALQGASSLAMAGNTTALTAQRIALWLTRSALMGETVATAAATEATWSFNAALAANPIGFIVLGITALVAGIGYLIMRESDLNDEYERRINLNINASMKGEADAVDNLVQKYLTLGMNMKEATVAAIKFAKTQIDLKQIANRAEVASLDQQIRAKTINLGVYGGIELPGVSALREKKIQKLREGTSLAGQSLGLTNYAIDKTKQDVIEKPILSEKDKLSTKELSGVLKTKDSGNIEDQVSAAIKGAITATITVKNDSNNAVMLGNGQTKNVDVMPKTVSTKVLQPLYGR